MKELSENVHMYCYHASSDYLAFSALTYRLLIRPGHECMHYARTSSFETGALGTKISTVTTV